MIEREENVLWKCVSREDQSIHWNKNTSTIYLTIEANIYFTVPLFKNMANSTFIVIKFKRTPFFQTQPLFPKSIPNPSQKLLIKEINVLMFSNG